MAETTTLHVTVLSSHYVGVNDTDDSASASFVASSAAHKKDTASVKAGVAVPKAASKDQDTYACRTSAEQLDSIARVLRTLVEQQHECPLSAQQPSENVARHVHRVQLAKAVRDGALPWLEVVPHLLEDAELGMLVSRGAAFGGDARSTLSTSSLLSDPSAALALAPAATTAATPASRTSSRGRSSGANNAGNAAGGAMSRRRTSSGSSRRGSTLVARQQSMTDAERQHFQAFVSSQLPMCEVVSVPATDAAIAPSSPPTTQNYYPIIFLYRLINEEEVVAALAALSSAGKDEAGGVTAERERQRRRTRASQASALVTRAVWNTLRPVLRAYLHRTGAAVVPTHLSVVWAVAEPCLLEGLNGYSSEDGRGDASFFSCPLTGPAADAVEVADGMTSVERWVRLVPRGVVYLYDPVSLSGSGAATVEAALAAFHVEHAADGPRSPVEAGTAKGDYRRGSADGGTRNAPPQRGSQATSSVHKAPRGISGGTASAAVAATRGRGGNGRDDGGLVSCTTTAATAAGNEPLSHALADPVDAAATTAALVDFDADPSAFPYCAVDAASLACYLYAGCDSAADSAAHATPARDLRGKAVTRFVAKAVAYQSAVLATISTKTLVNVKAKSSLRVTGELLQWMQDFLSAAAAADGDESHDSAALLNDVAKTSLTRTGLGASRWPLPLWVVAAVPLATIPPLPLRSSASVTSSAAQDAATLQPESAALSALTTWVSALAGERGDESCGGYGVELLLRQVARMGRLTSAYAAWTLQCTPRAAAAAAVNHASDSGRNADVDNDGTQEVDKKLVAGVVYFTHDAYTGGIFTVLNGVSALMAQASCSLADQKPPQMLTAVCAAAHGDDGAPVPPGTQPEAERAHHLSCCLFHRYRSPFQKLAAAQDGGGGAAETATVPRSLPAADAGKVSAAPTMATTAARVPGRCAVAVTETKESADVLLPPYPQEVVAMVRHFVAKNVGHFEVNTTRGTDTVAAAVNGNGAGASGGMASSAMVDSIVAGSFSPTARVTTLNMTTPSTDLLLRQQQQQQRRRLRGQGSGGVVPALRPYVHGVRLVKEVSKAHLGRRPNAEAAVLLQEAVESTLATPPSWSSASSFCHPTPRVNDAQETAEKAYVAKVNAFDLLQRYLTACHDTPSLHTQLAVTKAVAKRTDSALSAANAASAAAQALTARVYEHCLQQVMLHQLLREAGLEDVSEDWSVTEQVPPETIVPALVDFRERFGAHNVAVTASALDYCTHSTTPQPAAAPATVEKLFSDKLATIPTPGATVTRDAAARKVDEVHQTSAYAHNALNVHPTRRVTQLWMVGVAAPPQTSKQRDDAAAGQVDSWEKKREGERQRQRQPTSMPQSCRARKWVDMVPRAGSTTSMEVYAVWWSLLQAELKKKASSATLGRSLSSAADEGKCAPALTTRLVYQLVKQYVQRHAEASTALLRTAENIPSAPSEAATVSTAPMRFTTHETLFPCGDAMLEVWSSEAQRTCRYIKTNEVTAALHAGARPPDALSSPLRLAVRWDDGLLFSCSTTGAQQSSFVPLMDVQVTTSNFVLQRGAIASPPTTPAGAASTGARRCGGSCGGGAGARFAGVRPG